MVKGYDINQVLDSGRKAASPRRPGGREADDEATGGKPGAKRKRSRSVKKTKKRVSGLGVPTKQERDEASPRR